MKFREYVERHDYAIATSTSHIYSVVCLMFKESSLLIRSEHVYLYTHFIRCYICLFILCRISHTAWNETIELQSLKFIFG